MLVVLQARKKGKVNLFADLFLLFYHFRITFRVRRLQCEGSEFFVPSHLLCLPMGLILTWSKCFRAMQRENSLILQLTGIEKMESADFKALATACISTWTPWKTGRLSSRVGERRDGNFQHFSSSRQLQCNVEASRLSIFGNLTI